MKRQSNEMLLILSILKKPEKEMNANSLAESLAISSMGALKIAKKLESKGILLSKKIGNANILKINFGNDYAVQYVKLMLKKEAEEANYFVKRWISELRKINVPSVLYGSVINKKEKRGEVFSALLDTRSFSKDEWSPPNFLHQMPAIRLPLFLRVSIQLSVRLLLEVLGHQLKRLWRHPRQVPFYRPSPQYLR